MSQTKTDIPSFEEHFKQIKINLWLLGIPFNDLKIRYRFYLCFAVITLIVTAEFLFFFARNSTASFLELTQLVPCCCTGILSLLKILPIVAKRKKLFELINRLGELYGITITDRKNKKLIKNKMINVKTLLKCFFILNATLISVYNFLTPFFIAYTYVAKNEVDLRLPYAVYLPFSIDGWDRWCAVYFYSIFSGYLSVLFYTTVDALYCVLTCHICINFQIISNELQHLDKSSVNRLNDIIKNHQYVLQLSEYLEEIFNLPNLFNVLDGSIVICALGFNLTMDEWAQFPVSMLFLLSVLLQILIMSVFGENIIRESRRVGEAAFLCKWYEMNHNSKKKIMFIMTRSHKHQKLTTYNFSVISIQTFTKIINTSWSYFTILKTVYKPSDAVK